MKVYVYQKQSYTVYWHKLIRSCLISLFSFNCGQFIFYIFSFIWAGKRECWSICIYCSFMRWRLKGEKITRGNYFLERVSSWCIPVFYRNNLQKLSHQSSLSLAVKRQEIFWVYKLYESRHVGLPALQKSNLSSSAAAKNEADYLDEYNIRGEKMASSSTSSREGGREGHAGPPQNAPKPPPPHPTGPTHSWLVHVEVVGRTRRRHGRLLGPATHAHTHTGTRTHAHSPHTHALFSLRSNATAGFWVGRTLLGTPPSPPFSSSAVRPAHAYTNWSLGKVRQRGNCFWLCPLVCAMMGGGEEWGRELGGGQREKSFASGRSDREREREGGWGKERGGYCRGVICPRRLGDWATVSVQAVTDRYGP